MKTAARKIPVHRFGYENSAKSQNRGINEVFYYPGGILSGSDQTIRPGVTVLGWNEAHAIGFPDELFVEGMPERGHVLLVCFEDGAEEAWFHLSETNEAIEFLP